MTLFLSSRRDDSRRRPFELAIAAVGVVCIALEIAAHQRWLDRHFLPSFFMPREWYVRVESVVRAALASLGVAMIGLAGRVARFVGQTPGRAVSMVLAAALALGLGEIVLRRSPPRPVGWLVPAEEPKREPDPRLGWRLTPARVGRVARDGGAVDYAIDANGYRVRRLDEPVDRTRPSVLFAGESVMFGEGLDWDDTVPARVGAALGLQPVNAAVHGYSTDQAYLRLEQESPRFGHVEAIVQLFMTALFGRNLDDDRPHLDRSLTWQPARPPSRLMSLVALLVPYRTNTTVDEGIAMTRAVLAATIAHAGAHHATPLVVVPQLGRESAPEAALRHRIFDGSGIPYVFVEIDPEWHLPWDRHPDARGDRAIAAAVADGLRNLRSEKAARHSAPSGW
jgi:hypothetical protein